MERPARRWIVGPVGPSFLFLNAERWIPEPFQSPYAKPLEFCNTPTQKGTQILGELINEIPRARDAMQKVIANDSKIDIYIVIAKEQRRADALAQIQQLRDRGYRVDYPLTPTKVARQFQSAEDLGARIALLYGDEWPQVKVKNLATREESLIPNDGLLDSVAKFFNIGSSA